MWRLGPTGHFVPPLAMKIHEFWGGFPHNKPVDAAYERSSDGALVFFSENNVFQEMLEVSILRLFAVIPDSQSVI